MLEDNTKELILQLAEKGWSQRRISEKTKVAKSTIGDFLRQESYKDWWKKRDESKEYQGPKILTLDIETSPIKATVWGIWKQDIPLSRINVDWYILSWAAKWLYEDKVIYQDKRESWDTEDDKHILSGIWKLLDEADIIVTQNGKKFDAKKLNTRFLMNGFQPPSPYRHIDTLQEAKRHFGFTSNKLEFMTNALCKTYKKLTHGKYPGNSLWDECLKGNLEAWDEMEEYNIHDVLSLEELYLFMIPWMKSHPNVNVYYEDNLVRCQCNSLDLEHSGYVYTNSSKFDRFKCNDCGASVRGKINLLSKDKRQTLLGNIT